MTARAPLLFRDSITYIFLLFFFTPDLLNQLKLWWNNGSDFACSSATFLFHDLGIKAVATGERKKKNERLFLKKKKKTRVNFFFH